MIDKKYHIIGHTLCPYVQRVVILMLEKNIPYSRTDIDLNNKPLWLKDLSPTGKVPLLIINDNNVIFDSNVICNYLDEVTAGSLYPSDSLVKALHCSWITIGSDILDCIAKLIYMDKTFEQIKNTMNSMYQKFHIIEKILADSRYFSADAFNYIDVVFATIFRYFDVLLALISIDPINHLVKVNRWKKMLLLRSSVKIAVPENYNQLLKKFITNTDSYLSGMIAS